jgi:hypothetical protein
MSTGSTSAYVGACRKDIPYPSVSHESVPSLIDNLVSALYGTITKTVVNRRVVWNIPCDPNNTATINGIPRNAGEGLLCYIVRSLNLTTPSGFVTVDGVQTLTNKTLTAPVINNASISNPIVSNLTGTGTLTGNASTATTLQTARTIALSGEVTGTATSFDGSGNISIPVTINAGSVTPADLSTGGPSWTTGGRLTATSYQIGASTTITTGAGSPEGNITAPVGSFYTNTSPFSLYQTYVKLSGSGNTGWQGNLTVSNISFWFESTGSAGSLTSGVTKNITSITLSAGTWDVSGNIGMSLVGTTSTLGASNFITGTSITSNAIDSGNTFLNTPIIVTTGTGNINLLAPTRRLTLASSTTVYLIVQATFSAGTVAAQGTLRVVQVF